MEFKDRWHIIDERGKGGQGKVYCVVDASKFNEESLLNEIMQSIRTCVISSVVPNKT